MKIEIFSMMAAIGGNSAGTTWSGEVPFAFDGHYGSTIGKVFRFFNRVDDADSERLHAIGYKLPSLSVGDYFTLHFSEPRTYRVSGHGFEQVTGNQDIMMEVLK